MEKTASSEEQATETVINDHIGEPKEEGDNISQEKVDVKVAQTSDKNEKGAVSKRTRDDKHRKKDDKSVEHVLRALNSLNTPEEKLAAMCKKYADLVNDHRSMQNAVRQAEKRIAAMQREKEQLQGDQSKAVLVRSRLENLCRELQRQNKAIKEESTMKIREEEERRKEVSAKFQATLNDITAMMKQNSLRNSKLRDDNIDMTAKLQSVCQEFEKREMHVEKLVKQFQLEVQLADAKLAKAKMEMSSEREILLREKQQLLTEVVEYKTRLQQMQDSEIQWKKQMTLYKEKYEEFHNALVQSNQVISGFKSEMDKMSKQVRKLEKETSVWKSKYDETHARVLRQSEEKSRVDEELAKANKRVSTLHSLCHTLQDQLMAARKAGAVNAGNVTILPSSSPSKEEDTQVPVDNSTDVDTSVITSNDAITNPMATSTSIDDTSLNSTMAASNSPQQQHKLNSNGQKHNHSGGKKKKDHSQAERAKNSANSNGDPDQLEISALSEMNGTSSEDKVLMPSPITSPGDAVTSLNHQMSQASLT